MGKLIACLSECALRFGFAELMCGNHLFLLLIVETLPACINIHDHWSGVRRRATGQV